MNFFVIRGLAPGLDGLLAESEDSIDLDSEHVDLLCISRLRNVSIVQGDREPSAKLPEGALFIDHQYLQPTDDPGTREYEHSNIHGKFQGEQVYYKGEVKLVVSDFENLTAVDIRDDNRTLFSQNFLKKELRQKVAALVHEYTKDYTKDVSDMVFELREFEEEQRNGK